MCKHEAWRSADCVMKIMGDAKFLARAIERGGCCHLFFDVLINPAHEKGRLIEMKIRSVCIRNFRSYKEETRIDFDDLTAFIGKNDIGKSTIMEALDIFFNDGGGAVKMDKTDINVYASKENDNETVISVCFSELPDHIIIDSSVDTTLEGEYMLNSGGFLEVVKKYNAGGKASVFIRANHPTNPKCENLLARKNTELRRMIKEEGIKCDNQSVNADMRKAIWHHYSDDLQLKEIEIDVKEAKEIWEKLSSYLPAYSLFQSDRKNSDGDSEVQDPLKEAVKQILSESEIRSTLSSVANTVEAKLREVANRTLDKLREMDSDVASSLNPVFPSDKLKWEDVFKGVSISGDENIPINKRGSGVKRLVLLNFFRAEAERRALESDNTGVIYAIEEPETSQHSDNQRTITKALVELSKAPNTQVIITTHSPVVVKELRFENLRLICEEGKRKSVIPVEPSVLRYPSLNEVNFLAYGEATEEYHNELYGYLEYRGWLNEYKEGKCQRDYVRERNGKIVHIKCIMSEYIRHQIHHPENHNNIRFTIDELIESIKEMRDFIKQKNDKNDDIGDA